MPPAYVGSHKISGGGPYVDAFAAAAAAVALVLCAACARRQTWSRSGRGLALIVCVCLLWTGSSVAIQLILHGDPVSAPFRKPFFLTYASSALTMVYLPFYAERLRADVAARRWSSAAAAAHAEKAAPPRRTALARPRKPAAAPPPPPLYVAARLGALWFCLNLTFNLGLELTSVTVVTLLSSTSGLMTLVLSAARLGERLTAVKVAAVCLSFAGVAMVVLPRARSNPRAHGESHDAPGAALALGSAALYAAYAVQLKRWVPDESSLPMPYLFGLMGLSNSALMWPLFIILHLSGLERFAWPSKVAALEMALTALLGTVLSNMLLARAMLLASPVVATVGLSLSIPFAMASDALRGRGRFSLIELAGAACVWAGFGGIAAAAPLQKRLRACASAPKGYSDVAVVDGSG